MQIANVLQVWLGQRQLCRWLADRERAHEASLGGYDAMEYILPSNTSTR